MRLGIILDPGGMTFANLLGEKESEIKMDRCLHV
jgi:hypothetical protein